MEDGKNKPGLRGHHSKSLVLIYNNKVIKNIQGFGVVAP